MDIQTLKAHGLALHYSREAHKFGKHEGNYAALNLGLLALAVSTFGLLDPTFIRFLSLLAAAKVASFVEYRYSATSARMSSLA